ncbi:MAG: helix-turn-helix domain-containing protein [Clostridia bacterium]|nr:helix-turn-helix domain-containing protein [Clostridia bacterium]
MTFGKRIKLMREKKGWTQAELGERLGLSDKAVSTWEKDIKVPRVSTIQKIADLFGVTQGFLLGEEDRPVRPNREAVKIPVLGNVAAGTPIMAVEEYFDIGDCDTWEEIPEALARTGQFFGLRINGDSMEPKMSRGDIVIVRQQNDINSGEIGIVMVGNEEATCKKIKKRPDGIMLISTNPKYEPMYYNNEQIEELPVCIIGKVVELRAKF